MPVTAVAIRNLFVLLPEKVTVIVSVPPVTLCTDQTSNRPMPASPIWVLSWDKAVEPHIMELTVGGDEPPVAAMTMRESPVLSVTLLLDVMVLVLLVSVAVPLATRTGLLMVEELDSEDRVDCEDSVDKVDRVDSDDWVDRVDCEDWVGRVDCED